LSFRPPGRERATAALRRPRARRRPPGPPTVTGAPWAARRMSPAPTLLAGRARARHTCSSARPPACGSKSSSSTRPPVLRATRSQGAMTLVQLTTKRSPGINQSGKSTIAGVLGRTAL
jgi:hypothetical protein